MDLFTKMLLSILSPSGARGRLMIFPYHRVLMEEDPLSPGSPGIQRFERQLRRIRTYCNPLPLDEALERLQAGTLPARAVTITFDDGYANNLEIAAPLLKRYGIPATVFVAVDALERGIMWNDIIIEAVRAAGDEINANAMGLGRLELTPGNRAEIVKRLIACVQYLHYRERLERALELFQGVSHEPPPRLMLRREDLCRLNEFGIEVGAHTVNHPILTSLDDEEAYAEIQHSRSWIRDVTGTEPAYFAYPNGKRDDDYDARHVEMTRSAGFRAALSTNWGCATRRSPMHELPRFKPWEDSDFGYSLRLCKTVARSYLERPDVAHEIAN